MILPAHKAIIEWVELWKILEMKDGAIYQTEKTEFHLKSDEKIPKGFTTFAIYAKPNTFVKIVRFNK